MRSRDSSVERAASAPLPHVAGQERPAETSADFDTLVEQMLAGDADAFRLVYRSVQPRLIRYVTGLVGAHDAEDVTSETWSQAVRDLHRFHGNGDGFRAWITTIARHRALDHLRAAGRRRTVEIPVDELTELMPTRDDAEQGALDSISTAAALAMIRTLPPEQAEAVLLRAVMCLDAKSAGKVLGKRAGAVRTAAYRGLRSLAAQLEQAAAAGAQGEGEPRSDTFPGNDAEGVR